MPPNESQARVVKLGDLLEQAVQHQQAGRLQQARQHYLLFLGNRPDHPTAWTNYGALLRKLKRLPQSIAAHRRALQLKPGLKAALNNLSNALADHGEFEESAAIRHRLLDDEPAQPVRIRDYCAALRGLNYHDEVIRLVDAAEAAGHADGEVLLQRSLSRLMLGDYTGGFADFEHRYAGDEVSLPTNAPWPRWQGEPVDGRRVLVFPEQGFGDAILATRFLPGLKALGAEVHYHVKPPLRRLLGRVDGVDRQINEARISEPFDFYTPNMSLPHWIGLDGGRPPPPPRLAIPEDSRERAARIVAPFRDRFRIGVIWTGSLTFKSNNRRSTGPESFLGLAQVPGVQLFSLYKGEAHGEFIDSGMAGLIVDACGNDRDFADSAAVIDAMDLMITTDTAVVHVAGSLGKPIWNLLSHESFWLYGLGETTPWYPSMRLFRQARQGDWPGLFQRVETELRELLAARGR